MLTVIFRCNSDVYSVAVLLSNGSPAVPGGPHIFLKRTYTTQTASSQRMLPQIILGAKQSLPLSLYRFIGPKTVDLWEGIPRPFCVYIRLTIQTEQKVRKHAEIHIQCFFDVWLYIPEQSATKQLFHGLTSETDSSHRSLSSLFGDLFREL